ncbi:hypothetical protein HME9302_02169 [Alteripontixanthobacter maritimus]|uniref:Uncharacterized protein n=1 Tax=Alteripontixanthobacter maritimus TaxID=2161824 RepID=A0A369Q8Z6_9SPHN|nr:hypothetical protein [Alteripontixanthobacter maritimus]RDC60952.1 hypothetical protein HME9302_02169 [Alteripontixanthobacter maritimus]
MTRTIKDAVFVLGGMHFFNMNAIAKFGRKVGQWLHETPGYAAS